MGQSVALPRLKLGVRWWPLVSAGLCSEEWVRDRVMIMIMIDYAGVDLSDWASS